MAAHAACHDRIYRYFRRRAENASTAEDLCAEVFRIAWEKSGHGEGSQRCSSSGSLECSAQPPEFRARSANLMIQLQLERTGYARDADGSVHEALARLKPDEREVLLLTYWDGFSSAELSDLLNTTATAIRMRLHRARKALGRLLQTEQESEEYQR